MIAQSQDIYTQFLKDQQKFLDRQMLIQPSFNEQVGFDFQGLRQSYRNDSAHPDSKVLARFGRIWIYDIALSIYADLKAKRVRQAGYQVGRVMQLSLKEQERGFKGLWHFSYNTLEDPFVDPRGPTGANCWCLNAIYTFILATGDTSVLVWANRMVKEVLFRQQVTDSKDPRYGLVRAGTFNAQDMTQEEAMGYGVYKGNPNDQYEQVILEHCIDAAGTFRLAFRATKRFLPREVDFLQELIERHDLLMRSIRQRFWQGTHFVSAMDGQGQLFRGTDGLPSVAIDNNTWAAHVFLAYDPELATSSIDYVMDRFLIEAPPAIVEDFTQAVEMIGGLKGVYYFPASFRDPFVQVPSEHRSRMERVLQPEAAFGLCLFLKDAAGLVSNPMERLYLEKQAYELYDHTVKLLQLYGPSGAPYASANVPEIFTTLHSLTTANTGIIATSIFLGNPNGDFIGVIPPPEFLVDGAPPRLRSE